MSNIDKRALRDLATALDGDDWHAEGNSVYGGAYDVGDNVCHDHIASCESVNGESPLADFIAAANPHTVLALLDDLEAAEKRIAELESREVELPPYSFFDFKQGAPFKSGAYLNLDAVNAELSKLGIKFIAAGTAKGE